MAFCPSCGKKTKEGFCIDCTPKKEISIKDINIKICARCSKYFHKNKWNNKKDLASDLEKIAMDKLKDSSLKVKAILPKITYSPGIKAEFNYEVGDDSGSFILPARILMTYCDECSKKQGKYFEGTMQLREIDDDVLDYVDKYIKENNLGVADKREVENGVDLDISDQRKLQNLGHLLEKNFGGDLKISIRQFTQDRLSSKQVYRVNALYTGSPYKKGDVIKSGNRVYLLTSVRKAVSGIDLASGKKATIDINKGGYELLPVHKTSVSKVYPSIEVFDPESYQSVFVANKRDVKLGEKVKVANDNGRYYLV